MRRWNSRHLTVIAGLGGLLLASCSLPSGEKLEPAPAPAALQVERTLYSHAVAFPDGSAELPEGERQRLVEFLRESGADRNAEIRVTSAEQDRGLGERRQREVEKLLRTYGFSPMEPDSLLDVHEDGADDVLIHMARYHVILPDCPDHRRIGTSDYDNLPASNHGCSTLRNLGLMVANPRDLLRGRDLPPADAARGVLSIQRYRAGVQYLEVSESDE